jgi:hypothetical protein
MLTAGARVLIKNTRQQGTLAGTYGERLVVRFDNGSSRAFAPDQVEAAQAHALPANLKLAPPPGEDEEDVQAQAVALLGRAGFVVLQTSVRYHAQKCLECGAWARPTGGTGTTPGVPDLLVSHETWPLGLWLGTEMKDGDGGLTAAQELLQALGRIVVARSADEARGRVLGADAVFRAFGVPAPVLDRDAVDRARLKVEKAKIDRARRAAQKKRAKKT